MADDYTVGYGRPPTGSQFRKGTSGNPRGRPQGAKNLKTDLVEELAERVTLREGGRTRTVSKRRGMVKRLVNDAIGGKVAAAGQLVGLMLRLLDDGPGPAPQAPLSEEERAVLAELERRLLAPVSVPEAAAAGGAAPAGEAPTVGTDVPGEAPAPGSGQDASGPGPGPFLADPEQGGSP